MERKHVKCLIWKGLWGIGALSLLFAWAGFDMEFWFWNALVVSVLAVPIKLDCQSCKVCQV